MGDEHYWLKYHTDTERRDIGWFGARGRMSKHLLTLDEKLMADQCNSSFKVQLIKIRSLVVLLTEAWVRVYLQEHEKCKGNYIIENPTPTWVMTHESHSPGALCTSSLLSKSLLVIEPWGRRNLVRLVGFSVFLRLVCFLPSESYEPP